MEVYAEYLQESFLCFIPLLPFPPFISRSSVPIVVSEDGESPSVSGVVTAAQESFRRNGGTVSFTHQHHPFYKEIAENGYFKLSRHFQWALRHAFNGLQAVRVIVLEEDLEIAPDFFEFFGSVKNFVDSDESVLCASAWNDNGSEKLARDRERVYRSDFFPGLGWMIHKGAWLELDSKWPKAYWDDWLREPMQV